MLTQQQQTSRGLLHLPPAHNCHANVNVDIFTLNNYYHHNITHINQYLSRLYWYWMGIGLKDMNFEVVFWPPLNPTLYGLQDVRVLRGGRFQDILQNNPLKSILGGQMDMLSSKYIKVSYFQPKSAKNLFACGGCIKH